MLSSVFFAVTALLAIELSWPMLALFRVLLHHNAIIVFKQNRIAKGQFIYSSMRDCAAPGGQCAGMWDVFANARGRTSAQLMRRLQLGFDSDSTAVRLLIKGH